MKIRRNLIVAVVAAMMAAPAFGAVNANADNTADEEAKGFNDFTDAVRNNHVPTKTLWQQHGDPNGEANDGGNHFIYNQGWNYVIDNGRKISLQQASKMIDDGTGQSQGSQSTADDQSSQSGSQAQSSSSQYQNNNTNNGKLVQTGEHSTARKAGITAILIALAAFVAFKIKKVVKRN